MGKEHYQPQDGGRKEETKDFLLKWGTRLGLVAIGILGLRWIL